jgi:hypothetical protein
MKRTMAATVTKHSEETGVFSAPSDENKSIPDNDYDDEYISDSDYEDDEYNNGYESNYYEHDDYSMDVYDEICEEKAKRDELMDKSPRFVYEQCSGCLEKKYMVTQECCQLNICYGCFEAYLITQIERDVQPILCQCCKQSLQKDFVIKFLIKMKQEVALQIYLSNLDDQHTRPSAHTALDNIIQDDSSNEKTTQVEEVPCETFNKGAACTKTYCETFNGDISCEKASNEDKTQEETSSEGILNQQTACQDAACEICTEQGSDICKRQCCNVIACEDCTTRYIEDKIKERNINVPCLKCDTLMTDDEIRAGLNENKHLQGIFEELLLDINLKKEGIVRKKCPKCGVFHQLYKHQAESETVKEHGIRIVCQCGCAWCFPCHMTWHAGVTCHEVQTGDLTELTKWAEGEDCNGSGRSQAKAKPCPGCRTFIQRSDSCLRMKCTVCGSAFCYACGDYITGTSYYHKGCVEGDHHDLALDAIRIPSRYPRDIVHFQHFQHYQPPTGTDERRRFDYLIDMFLHHATRGMNPGNIIRCMKEKHPNLAQDIVRITDLLLLWTQQAYII